MALPHKSTWREAQPTRDFPPLRESLNVDVAIIGGGITGITAAYLLRNSGKSVTLLERGQVGDWATGSTTGFLMELLDTYATELISRWGKKEAAIITRAHRDAITLIEETTKKEKIACEFVRCPAYLYASTEKEASQLQEEAEALQTLGTDATFTAKPLGSMHHGRLEARNQAKFHSLKYIFALADVCAQAGVQLFENTEVTTVEDGPTVTLHTKEGQRVRARHVLMATHYPLDPQPSKLRFKKAWYTTYVLEAKLPKGALPEALYEDLAIPYHYARIDPQEEYDRLIFGGEDHRADVAVDEEKSFTALESSMREWLGPISYTLTRTWKGRIVEPGDGIAYLGPVDGGSIFYATGYSGTGLTYATIAAQLFADFVMGRENPAAAVYAARRPFSLREYLPKAIEYIQEFFGGAVKNTFQK
jgi:glycine/D-amino acid oxidase-like deaminating enzyme